MEMAVGAGVEEATPEVKARGEVTFLIWIISLVNVLLGVERKKVTLGLMLPDGMSRALISY